MGLYIKHFIILPNRNRRPTHPTRWYRSSNIMRALLRLLTGYPSYSLLVQPQANQRPNPQQHPPPTVDTDNLTIRHCVQTLLILSIITNNNRAHRHLQIPHLPHRKRHSHRSHAYAWFPPLDRIHQLLRALHGNGKKTHQPTATDEHKEQEYDVQRIVDSKHTAEGDTLYLVKWTGYPDSANTWQTPDDLQNAKEKITTYHSKHPHKPKPPSFRHIDTILASRYTDGTEEIQYLIKWAHCDHLENSWHPQKELINAKDKIADFHAHNREAAKPKHMRKVPRLGPRESRVADTAHRIISYFYNSGPDRQQEEPDSPPKEAPRRTNTDASNLLEQLKNNLNSPLRATNGEAPFFEELTSLPPPEQYLTHLVPICAKIHLFSRRLATLPPAKRWTPEIKHGWVQARGIMAFYLRDAIDAYQDKRDPLALLNAVLNLLALPGHYLMRAHNLKPPSGTVNLELPDKTIIPLIFGNSPTKPPRTSSIPAQDIARTSPADILAMRAAKHMRNDRMPRATQSLVSNGTAPPTLETANILTNMHLDYQQPLQLHGVKGRQILTSEKKGAQALRASAGTAGSIDTFGWADDMHLVDRNFNSAPNAPLLIDQIGRLIALCTNADIPPAVAFVLTCGSLTALNKVSQEEQAKLTREGKQPKIRPINNGTQIVKKTFRIGAATPSALRVKEQLKPIQLGLGTKAGPETLALIARAAYKAGIPILTDDCVNGFNAASRQHMLDAVDEVWPEANALFNCFYSQHSPVFYSYRDPDNTPTLRVILSKEGSRMGCTWGSLAFDILVHHFIHKPLIAEFPNVHIKALTDDTPSLHPFTGTTDEDWQRHYEGIFDYRQRFCQLLAIIGLSLHPEKTMLLLPPNAPTPIFKPGKELVYSYDGAELAGAPIGSAHFISSYLQSKFTRIYQKILKICTLAHIDPQTTMHILTKCASVTPSYLQRVVHTAAILPFCQVFDQHMQKARDACMNIPNVSSPSTSDERLERAISMQTLPVEYGGTSQTPTTTTAPLAAISAFLAARTDPLLKPLLHLLKDDIAFSYQTLYDLLGIKSIPPTHPLARLMPIDADTAIKGLHSTPPQHLIKFDCRIQACAVPLIMYRQRMRIRLECARAILSNNFTNTLTIEDATHVLAITSRSQNSRIFVANLWFEHNRIPQLLFVTYYRYHFNLPQLLRGPATTLNDSQVRPCALQHDSDQFICPTGAHAFGCPSAYGARTIAHNSVRDCIVSFANEILLLHAKSEPPTTATLLHEYSKAETHLLFPKKKTPANTALINELNACRRVLKEKKDLTGDEINALQQNIDRILQEPKDDAKCITLDVLLTDPQKQETWWIDVARIHPTVKTRIKDAADWFANEAEAERRNLEVGTNNPYKGSSSAPVHEYVDFKFKHYALMRLLASRQVKRGMRKFNPTFLAGIISHTGEFSKGVFDIVELIANNAKKLTTITPSLDGLTPARVSAEIRTRFKDALATCNAIGVANAFLDAGIPKSGQVRSNQVEPTDVPY